MKVKLDKRDRLFSKLIRERVNWTCQRCGRYHPEGQRQSLHCSHIFSRRKRSVRWHPDNAVAHCFACHQYLGENPIEFAAWAEGILGEHRMALLRSLAGQMQKWTKPQLEDLYQDMKAAHEDMVARRNSGETGRLEFEL